MATQGKDFSNYDADKIPDASALRFGIVVSEWNSEITGALLQGTLQTFNENGLSEEAVIVRWVPGSFELALGAQILFEEHNVHAVVCLGSIVQGETKHFDFVCQSTAQGIMDVGLKFGRPAIFGVLTDNNMEQARARSGGIHGNKGVECAIAAIKMAVLKEQG